MADRFWCSSRAEAEWYAREKYGRGWRRKVRIERPGGAGYRKAGWVIREVKPSGAEMARQTRTGYTTAGR